MNAKADTRTKIAREIEDQTKRSSWTLLQKLALSSRLLAGEGHWRSGLAGQISARADEPGYFWTLRFGVGADEATVADFVEIDEELVPRDGKGMANPATRFHMWTYRRRPEVRCIVHTHPKAVSALSMLEEELVVSHMDATPFHEDCAFLKDWPGLPVADEEGRIISEAIGTKRSLLLAHHGLLTTGTSIEQAVVLALWMEQAAELQLMARAAGEIRPIEPHLAQESHDFLLGDDIIGLTFAYFARRTLRRDPTCLD